MGTFTKKIDIGSLFPQQNNVSKADSKMSNVLIKTTLITYNNFLTDLKHINDHITYVVLCSAYMSCLTRQHFRHHRQLTIAQNHSKTTRPD